jgi:multisubunit Na+/H+ antiporter MnhB subunit
MTTLLALLFVFMIVAAIAAIMLPDLLSAVISIGALGFAASVAFLMLKAPDVAIVMPIVEVLALVLYIRATVRRDVKTVSGTRDVFGAGTAVVLIALLAVFMIGAARELPEVGDPPAARNAEAPSSHYIEKSLEETGAGNAVMAVLLDYRGYDTLGEATVLFAAVLGAVTLLRQRARRKMPEGGAS